MRTLAALLAVASAGVAVAAPDPPAPVETLTADPLPPAPVGGWFAGLEVGVARPHVRQYPSDLFDGVPLAVTASPEATAGYRFAGGRAIAFDYRYLASAGTRDYYARPQPVGLGPALLPVYEDRPYTGRGAIDFHTFDLDLIGRRHDWWIPFVSSRWTVGARAAALWADVREPRTFDDRPWGGLDGASEWFGDERAATTYRGLGPHFAYRLAVGVKRWGLEVFAESDQGVLFGTRTTRYSPADPQPVVGGRTVGPVALGLDTARPASERRFEQTAWHWRGDVGVRWAGEWGGRRVSASVGWRAEGWSIGGESAGGASLGSWFGGSIVVPDFFLSTRGAFLRVEVGF